MREEIRHEVAERMAHLQRENDVLRSHVQLVVSIASNSMIHRMSDARTAATRLDLGFTPTATDPPATSTDPPATSTDLVSLTLGPSPTGEQYSTVISQVIPYTPLVPETTPVPNVLACYFPESLQVRSRGTSLYSANQSMPSTGMTSALTEPSIPHYRSRTCGDPDPSSFMQDARCNEPDVSFLECQTQRSPRPVTSSATTFPERRPEIIFIPSLTRPEITQMARLTISMLAPIQLSRADQMSMMMEQMRQMQDKINGLPRVPLSLDRASWTCYAD
ncbi:unnamed protein product [Cuscuta epithymum]|uniref:Uncharacterized protein n=1 Tax=Cuscuta epithymum TaxID=186058 RepID=A0AAV0G6H1_9ASTE|nr:unnamed protein product [Cuscuta epithymum]